MCLTGLVARGLDAVCAYGCDYLTVRDSAFDQPRDVHPLCVVGPASDSETLRIRDRMSGWLKRSASDLNIELHFLATDDPDTNWASYGIPSAPHEVPAVVLIGYHSFEREHFILHEHVWLPEPTDEQLNSVLDSPLRIRLREVLPTSFAVLLHVPARAGPDPRTAELLDQLSRRWAAVTDMPVPVMRMDRSDPKEQLVRSFIKPPPDGDDWVGIVFGRGKFLSPPFTGDAITEANLEELLQLVMGDCTCSRSARSLGVDLPMLWTRSNEEAVALLYDEEAAAASETQPVVAAPTPPTLANATGGDGARRPTVHAALISLGGIVLAVGLLATLIAVRRQRRVA